MYSRIKHYIYRHPTSLKVPTKYKEMLLNKTNINRNTVYYLNRSYFYLIYYRYLQLSEFKDKHLNSFR